MFYAYKFFALLVYVHYFFGFLILMILDHAYSESFDPYLIQDQMIR